MRARLPLPAAAHADPGQCGPTQPIDFADSPTGCGSRIVTPVVQRSSRWSAAIEWPVMRQVPQPRCRRGGIGSLPVRAANCRKRAGHAAGARLLEGQALEEEEDFAVLDGYRDRSGCNPDAEGPQGATP